LAPKQFPGNVPTVVRSIDGALTLPATKAEIYGKEIAFEAPFQNIGFWHDISDHVIWTVQLDVAGRFDVYLDYACADNSAGNIFRLEGTEPAVRRKVAGTGGWDKYRLDKIGTVELPAGFQRLTLRPDAQLKGALMDLRAVYLVPPGQTPKTAVETSEPAALARMILDDKIPAAKRQTLVNDNLDRADEVLAALVADLKPSTPEEYRRIPWIWRVAIAAGKKNDPAQLGRILRLALPKTGEPLYDWQAVVLGGGLINGVSQQGAWPAERFQEILKDKSDFAQRWRDALAQASVMADNAKVPTGTRYDALRMLALDTWQCGGRQLAKYLAKGTHAELQMGAVSGLGDMKIAEATKPLLAALPDLPPQNRRLAVDALLRTDDRITALLDALEKGEVQKALLSEAQVQSLLHLQDEPLRKRARGLFKK